MPTKARYWSAVRRGVCANCVGPLDNPGRRCLKCLDANAEGTRAITGHKLWESPHQRGRTPHRVKYAGT